MDRWERKPRKRYTKEHKLRIIRELESSHLCLSELARKYDIHPVTLYSWRRKMTEQAKSPVELNELFLEN